MAETNTNKDSDIKRALGIGRTSNHGKHTKLWIFLGLLVLVLAIGVILRSMTSSNGKLQYRTEAARKGDLTVTVTATGNLEPTNMVDLGIEVSGTVKTVEADYNDHVKIGQVLARLDTTKLDAQAQQSKATLAAARARVLQAQATVEEVRNALARLQRARELSGGKVPSQHDLDAAEATLKRARADEASARAAVSESQAALEIRETDLAKAVIYSPIDGIVLTRAVEPGQTVAASFQAPVLFTLAEDLAQMELHVDVDEADVGEVREGQMATFSVDAYPDRSFPASITQVRYGSQEVAGVITYETVLKVDNADLSLRPGMTATANITVKSVKNALLVPNAALRFTPPRQTEKGSSGGSLLGNLLPRRPRTAAKPRATTNADKKQQVWVIRDQQPTAIPVTTGATDGIMTQLIGNAIEPGMELIVDTVSSTQ